MKQIIIQAAKSVSIWIGLIIILAIIAMPLGLFSIQAYITPDALLMGIYSPDHLGTPAAFNPLVQALEGFGLVAFLLNPLALLAMRKWWHTRVRPWLFAIAGLVFGMIGDMLFSFSPTIRDITTESLWPEFWVFFCTVVFGLIFGYGIEFLLAKNKRSSVGKRN
jgi:amino acid transporter